MRLLSVLKVLVLWIVIASVLLSAVSCTADPEQAAKLAEYEAKLAQLVYRKQQLMKERDALDPSMEKVLGNTSYMSLIFTEIDSALYTDVYPVMDEDEDVKIVGVMAFSENEIPGTDNNITLDQYKDLAAAGWGNALYWNGQGELEDFIETMTALLGEVDIELPTSIMFAKDTYLSSYDALLLEHGIENAVHSGGEDLDFVEKNEPEGVWHPGCIGWRWIGKSTLLKRAVERDGGYALFEIAFNNAAEHTRTSYFPIEGEVNDSNRPKIFVNMIKKLLSSIKDGSLEVYNIDQTREKVAKYHSDRRTIENENNIRREEIKNEIRDIERQMADLYDEYYEGD